MDVAADDGVGVVQHRLDAVGEHDLRLSAGGLDDGLVVVHVVHAGEGVDDGAEGGAELLQGQHIVPGVDAGLVQLVHGHQVVTHLVRGITEHQHHLFDTSGDALQQQGEAVAAKDGERDAHGLAAGLGADISGDLLYRGVVALAAGHHGLSNGHDVAVTGGDAVVLQCVQHGIGSDLYHVVALAENGSANAPYHSTQGSAHSGCSFAYHFRPRSTYRCATDIV